MILYDRRAFFKYIISNQAVKCPLNKKVGIKNCKKEVKTTEKSSDSRAFQSTKSLLTITISC